MATSPMELVHEDADLAGLLDRLEQQAAESGRLEARVETLERALAGERDTRRRAVQMLKRERKAAAAIAERAEREAAGHAAAAAEAEQLRQAVAATEQQLHSSWTRVVELERRLALKARPLWRKLLRLPPAG